MLFGCGGNGKHTGDGAEADAVPDPDIAQETDPAEAEDLAVEDVPEETAEETGPDVEDIVEDEVVRPPSPYVMVRGLIHMHSPYSHDACDGHGLEGGVPDAVCMAELRAAPCIAGLDFVALTDHPDYMRDYPLEDDMLYMPALGDSLVMDGDDPVANRVDCPDGSEVMFTVGFESNHSMPLGFRRHMPSPDLYEGIDDTTPLDRALELNAAVEAAGAVKGVVHSEGPEISAGRIDEAGFEAMEWYNTHANIMELIGGDTITGEPADVINTLGILEDFLIGSSGPHPDLVLVAALPMMPMEGFAKWEEVQRGRPITGLLGSDAHRNVSVDPVCSGIWQTLCELLATLYPSTLTLLISGGAIVLNDGDRIDSYQRIARWVENRVFVTEMTFDQLGEALRAGRGYGLFSVFGDPEGFAFEGYAGSTYVAMGDTVHGEVTLRLQAPLHPTALAGAPFTEEQAMTALVRVLLKRIDATGTSTVRELDNLGEGLEETFTQPGAYYVEVWLRPYHLETALASQSDLASAEYLWLITNPIRLEP